MLDQPLSSSGESEASVPQHLLGLSQRETQVLKLASEGLTNGAIANQLDVSVHAVKFHLASVYRKLRVTNRTEAAVAYLRAAAPAVAAEKPH